MRRATARWIRWVLLAVCSVLIGANSFVDGSRGGFSGLFRAVLPERVLASTYTQSDYGLESVSFSCGTPRLDTGPNQPFLRLGDYKDTDTEMETRLFERHALSRYGNQPVFG